MNNFKLVLAFILVNLLLLSCHTERSRQDKVSTMISHIDSPFFIATLTPQNLIEKSGIEDGVLSYIEQTFVSFFISSQNTGIDNKEQVQIIASKGSGITPDIYSIFKLSDPKKFEFLIKKELNEEVKEKDGFKYFIYDNYYIIAWQGEFAVGCNITIDIKTLLGGKGSSNSKVINKCISLLKASNEADLNTKYKNFLSKNNDISTYFETKNVVTYLKNTKDIKTLEEKFNNTTHESELNFEIGKITLTQNFILTDLLKKELGFITNKGIDSELFKYGNSKNPIVSYSVNLNSNKALEYLKTELNISEFSQVKNELNKTGLTVDELAGSFTGQVLIMVDNFETKIELTDIGHEDPVETKHNEPIMGAVFGIKDKSILSKSFKDITVLENGFMTFESQLFGYVNDHVFFVSNDSNWVVKVMNGKSVEIEKKKELTDNPYGLYAINDLEKNKHLIEGDMLIAALFTKAYGFANLDHSNFTIELKNTTDNALKVISKYLSKIAHQFESDSNLEMEEMLDNEILEDVEDALKDVEKALEDVDVNSLMDDLLKEVNK